MTKRKVATKNLTHFYRREVLVVAEIWGARSLEICHAGFLALRDSPYGPVLLVSGTQQNSKRIKENEYNS